MSLLVGYIYWKTNMTVSKAGAYTLIAAYMVYLVYIFYLFLGETH